MLLTRQAQIAVAILVTCARAGDRYVQNAEAAVDADATNGHTAKVAHLLRCGGFITTARGPRGGIKLSLPPKAISVGAVLRHMQPNMAQTSRRRPKARTTLDTVVETGWQSFVQVMDRFTIADLVAGRVPQRSACQSCRLLAPETIAPAAIFSMQ